MATVNPSKFPFRQHTTQIRVRYQETDAQGHTHHTTYLNYFEIGRIEMLRAAGHSYRDLEESGIMLVVSEIGCKFFHPANYDDLLDLETTVVSAKGVRIHHSYKLTLGDQLVCEGHTVVASIGKDGKVKRLPEWLRM